MRKQRPIREFASLTPEQKNQLYSWFRHGYTYDQLCAMVAQPAPHGFGLKVSKDKMFRYYHRWQEIQELQEEDNSITVEAYDAFLNGDPAQLTAQSIQRIKTQAFLLTMQEQSDPAVLLKLLHVFDFENARHLSERRQCYKERHQEFSQRRLHLKTVGQAPSPVPAGASPALPESALSAQADADAPLTETQRARLLCRDPRLASLLGLNLPASGGEPPVILPGPGSTQAHSENFAPDGPPH